MNINKHFIIHMIWQNIILYFSHLSQSTVLKWHQFSSKIISKMGLYFFTLQIFAIPFCHLKFWIFENGKSLRFRLDCFDQLMNRLLTFENYHYIIKYHIFYSFWSFEENILIHNYNWWINMVVHIYLNEYIYGRKKLNKGRLLRVIITQITLTHLFT